MRKLKRPVKSIDATLKSLCWLNQVRGKRAYNYFEVQANTNRFSRRAIPIDLVHYAVWKFLAPEGKVKLKTDTSKWNGDRFKYTLTSKVDCFEVLKRK